MNPIKWFLRQAFPERYRTDEEQAEIDALRYEVQYGVLNPKLQCKYCNGTESVRYKRFTRKAGFSAGKATAAVLTGGYSLLATGLSKQEGVGKFYCENCKMSWEQ
jgi:hypothetical protein